MASARQRVVKNVCEPTGKSAFILSDQVAAFQARNGPQRHGLLWISRVQFLWWPNSRKLWDDAMFI
ncbi:MAG: hypothetical protein V4734_05085, partial [Terriglobus sp.]